MSEKLEKPGIANVAEPEITPTMIRAGVSALIEYDELFETAESAARRIFIAMALAAPHPERP